MAHVTELEDLYQEYHALLFAIAYRMLGRASDAEDVVHDTFLRYTQAPPDEIRSPKAYLTTITTRLCLDQLKSARTQREQYIGIWLPEPILTTGADEAAELHESVSLAFLLLLERLTPYERAVFLLREVFDFGYDEIAEIVGKSATYCRQIFHQAKTHVQEQRHRYASSPETQQRLVREFLTAIERGDVEPLVHTLAEDVIWWADGGGKVYASPYPQEGRERVLRILRGLVRLAPSQYPDLRVALVTINGAAGMFAWSGETLLAAFGFEVAGDRITRVYNVLSPDKLRYAQRQAQRQR